MGKKKSVVLMTLLTIVIVVLSALTAFPKIDNLPGTVKKWNPAMMQYDLGMDLGGGYYAYYYPEGVITETEYENNLADKTDEEKAEYAESYFNPEGSSLYFDTDEDKNIVSDGVISEDFTAAFNAAAAEIEARYAAMGYSDYSVAIVDNYAIKVTLPASEVNAGQVISSFMLTGEMTIQKGGSVIDELKGKETKVSDLIKSISVGTQYDVAFLRINFTKAGKEMLAGVKSSLTASTGASTEATTLDILVGETKLVSIYQDHISDNNTAKVPMAYVENKDYVEMASVLLNSVLKNGSFDIEFQTLATSDIRSFAPVYGENIMTMIFIAGAIAIVGLIALAIVKMGRFGGVSAYNSASYLIVVGLCFAFISKGVFEITLGSVLVFFAGLVLVNVLQAYVYNAIKAEFSLGKTVESSVKAGYNKTFWTVVDVYAVLLLASLALLIGGAGVYTLALQAIICVITGAFCNLLWGRFINFTFLSASKNKYQYFRFVREDDDDE
ncbi:MAG: hypothetical protein E7349_07330 [Clostridiales bacterium]|nr:hypothetical protein [Clostridiales bacterium]